jgi:hypothetical protein
MAANPVIRLGSKRAHIETTVLGQHKKKSSRTALQPQGVVRSLPNVLWAWLPPTPPGVASTGHDNCPWTNHAPRCRSLLPHSPFV